MNDGEMSCGAYYTIELNQEQPHTIVVSTEGKGVGIAPFRDPSQYCVYVDIQYKDGDSLYGQVISFFEGTHVIHYKELVLPVTKPVKLLTAYIMLQTGGNAFFRSFSVRQQIKAT